MRYIRNQFKWFVIGIGIKRWLIVFTLGVIAIAIAILSILLKLTDTRSILELSNTAWTQIALILIAGIILIIIATIQLTRNLTAPFRLQQNRNVVDALYDHSKRGKGTKIVTIGGGTGLPSVLRALKPYVHNLTAIVTVADDGGSSGRLRRELGILPPGDIRNNIVALADDESLMTKLFQYRFETGDLSGHSFGNLFIAAMTSIVEKKSDQQNTLGEALIETERVLNIQGRVLPATLDDVNLEATIKLKGTDRVIRVRGESQINDIEGKIETMTLQPENATAYTESVKAIEEADFIIVGPGSLYTSILPNLLVTGIQKALQVTSAHKIYICNVATQPVETEGYNVADHILALEKHIGRGIFQTIVANNKFPTENAGENTHYVQMVPRDHEVRQRYSIIYADLTDFERPWRHDSKKLASVILRLSQVDEKAN